MNVGILERVRKAYWGFMIFPDTRPGVETYRALRADMYQKQLLRQLTSVYTRENILGHLNRER